MGEMMNVNTAKKLKCFMVFLNMQKVRFVKKVYTYYEKHGRKHLPWRKTKDPYKIMVSEIMLQQTQAERVIPKYTAFIKRFPDVETLAKATIQDVLTLWVGLGYNRRALNLKRAAEYILTNYKGKIPKEKELLMTLPGIGEYTSSAIRAFAFNVGDVFIETNIRSVFIHEFFKDIEGVTDKDITPFIEQTLDMENPRKWYSALMDYGTMVKKEYGNPNKRMVGHKKQKPFKGSLREVRGAIIKLLVSNPKAKITTLSFKKEMILKAKKELEKEGLLPYTK